RLMRSRSATSLMVSSCSWLVTGLSLLYGWRSDGGGSLAVVLAGAGCGGEREFGVSGDGAADAVGGPDGGQDPDDGVVQGAVPGVAVGVRGAQGAAVVGAGRAELAEGDGIAAGFGQGMPAVAEHVRPGPVPVAELPGGGDHAPVVGRAAQPVDVGF